MSEQLFPSQGVRREPGQGLEGGAGGDDFPLLFLVYVDRGHPASLNADARPRRGGMRIRGSG